MSQEEMREFALAYLFKTMVSGSSKQREDYSLNHELNYLLCNAYDRIQKHGGEVTKHDTIVLIECWIIKEGTNFDHQKPLCSKENS